MRSLVHETATAVPARIVVCADDYGLTPGVSRGIRELIAKRRISATSAMTVSPHWPQEATALRAVAGDCDVGLHIVLTDHQPLGRLSQLAPDGRLPPLSRVFRAGLARRLPMAEVEREIERQLDAFVAAWGAPPSHIDGHHHVHQLPGVRAAVVRLARRIGGGRTWVRCCNEQLGLTLRRGVATGKSFVIGSLGASVERLAHEHGVPTNAGFAGVYDFEKETRPYAALCARFLVGQRDNGLLMCHPGYSDAELGRLDTLTTHREAELAYLAGDAWPAALSAHGLELGPLRRA